MAATTGIFYGAIPMGSPAIGICPTDSMGATAVPEYPAAPVEMAGSTPTGTISTTTSFGVRITTRKTKWQKALVQESGSNHWPFMLYTGSRSRAWLRWLRRLNFIGT